MGKADTNTKDQAAKNASDMNLLDLLLKGAGAVELRLERTIYAAEECGAVPLAGFIIDLLDMPPIPQGANRPARDWQAFVFKATYKTKGKSRGGDIVDVEPGEEVIIPATYQIQAALARFARDPKVMHEIALQPKEKIDIGGDREFWTYRVVKTGKTEERGSVYALSDGGRAAAKEPAQLPSADGTHNVDQKTGEAVPATPAAS